MYFDNQWIMNVKYICIIFEILHTWMVGVQTLDG